MRTPAKDAIIRLRGTWYHGGPDLGPAASLAPPVFTTRRFWDATWFARQGREEGSVYGVDVAGDYLDVMREDGYEAFLSFLRGAGVKFEEEPYFQCDEVSKFCGYEGSNPLDAVYIPRVRDRILGMGLAGVHAWDTLANADIEVAVILEGRTGVRL